jgi:murein DD-endopeptidase MepM/ murein hydrolase activator NlpD
VLALILFVLLSITVHADTKKIDKKISLNKKLLKNNKSNKNETDKRIIGLATEINKEEVNYTKIQKELRSISTNILLNKIRLSKAKKDIVILNQRTRKLKKFISQTENAIVDSISNEYSMTLGKNITNKVSINEIIDTEVYKLLLSDVKDKVLSSNLEYFKLSNEKRKNDDKKIKLSLYIKSQEIEKAKYNKLVSNQKTSLNSLEKKHKSYQNKLKDIVKKQNKINSLLGNLNILKVKEIKKTKRQKALALKKERARKKALKVKALKIKKLKIAQAKKDKANKTKVIKEEQTVKNIKIVSKKLLEDDIDLKVRNIGSTTKGIRISNYQGNKTMSPLKSFKVTKKFGSYYDPVYKIKLFNESISMESKIPNAKVYSILKGKVVYAKHNDKSLGNVIILKHSNKMHTIYSQLSKIPKTIKVGKWIQKGYVIGRIKKDLIFQITKNNKYIDPQKVFK